MPRYSARLSSSDGKLLQKQIHAATSDEVYRYFREDGYFVFSVKREFALPGREKKVSMRNFLLFNREMMGLIRAGLTIVDGLSILLKKMPPSALKSMLVQVREKLTKGSSLSEAFKAFKHVIPAYYPTLLYSGEQSGQLAPVLEKFIQQEERKRKAIKKFRQALTYPIILLIVSAIALYVILGRAMPEFASLYADSGQDLPAITQFVIALSNIVASYSPYLFLLAVGLFFLIPATKKMVSLRSFLEKSVTWVPVLGKVWRLYNQNSFVSTMKLLLQGGIPMAEALKTMQSAVPSRRLSLRLEKVWNDVICGEDLSDALEKHTDFENRVMEMIRIGETSGTLDEMLEHLIVYGEEQLDDHLEWISGIVAPMLLLFVGVFIAALVLAMYLPMFQVTDLISK